ncbi:hypothetical protein AMJ49_02925 [Parcubacteria bacterium DG_74_2]|nr:MAG: hypothetical protein AMJ49_02925 [Parcubacteria bacterium DG_74_2]
MNDLNSQQTQSDPKGKALASLILAIVSLLPVILFLFFIGTVPGGIEGQPTGTRKEKFGIFALYFLLTKLVPYGLPFLLIAAIVGIILGVKGLKSTKRRLAIWGIALSVIGLIIDSLILLGILGS